MFDPLDFHHRPLFEKLQRARFVTRLSILAERLAEHGWRAFTWSLFIFGLWLFQIPDIIGNGAPILTLALFFGGLVYFLYTDGRQFRLPSSAEIDMRIERASAFHHRPLSGLQDKPVNAQKQLTKRLWDSHTETLRRMLPFLRSAKPRGLLATKDPRALRLAAMLFFVGGVIVAGGQWDSRISAGLTPLSFQATAAKSASALDIWITPPDYTGLAPLILTEPQESPLQIPAGSTLKASLKSSWFVPVLVFDGAQYPFERPSDDNNYVIEHTVPQGRSLAIKSGVLTKASYSYDLIPDEPPKISETMGVQVLEDFTLQFPLTLYDDYGVKTLSMTMALDPVVEQAPIGQPYEETRSIISPAKTNFEIRPVYDLTAHPWAGLPAIVTFTIVDGKGQETKLAPISLTLPEREFRHPVAQKLIEIRKKLAWNPLSDYKSATRELERFLGRPAIFQNNIITYLSLRSIASRLYWDRPSETRAQDLIRQLWDTALHIEQSNISLAARNLRNAQQALERALQNPGGADIDTLMNDVRQAMAEYLMELQKEMQKRMAEGEEIPMIPPELLSQMANPDALANFLDELEQHLKSGDGAAAQEMLSQLQRMLDSLNPNAARALPPDVQMMSKGINELQELIKRQEDLLKQTQKQAALIQNLLTLQRSFGNILPPDTQIIERWGGGDFPPAPKDVPQTGKTPLINTQDNKTEQEALRFILGQLMLEAGEVLDEIPENLGLAEQEMRGSSASLSANAPDKSVPHQEKAIEHLKKAQKQLNHQMATRMKQLGAMALLNGAMRYDPLGRPYGGYGDQEGMMPGSHVQIPDEAERKRAHEILRLLRERSSELGRPEHEIEYYRRLLKQF